MTEGDSLTRRSIIKRLGVGTAAISVTSLSGCSSSCKDGCGPKPDPRPGVGVFLGDDTKLEQWENWFGQPLDYYSVALFNNSWEDYEVDNWPLEIDIGKVAQKYQLIVTFNMHPSKEDLTAVATGQFNQQYRELAEDLVANQLSDAWLRFGSEFNGKWSRATAVGRPDLFVEAWKQIVMSMRSLDDASFNFIWAPNIWRYHMNPVRAYPGDEWVDAIGLTVYDKGKCYSLPDECNRACIRERRNKTWELIMNGRDAGFGLEFWAQFARNHDTPLVFPEYGPVARNAPNPGGGDNPIFFENFYQWMQSNKDIIGWHNLWAWTRGPHFVGPKELKGKSNYSALPEASETFRRLFGGD